MTSLLNIVLAFHIQTSPPAIEQFHAVKHNAAVEAEMYLFFHRFERESLILGAEACKKLKRMQRSKIRKAKARRRR